VGGSTTLRTAVGMVGASWYGRWADRWGGRRFLLALFGGFTAVFAGIAAVANPIVIIALFAVVLNSPLTLGVQLVLADVVPPDSRDVAMGWVQSVSGLAIFVGTTVLGVAAGFVGARAIPTMAAGLMGVAGVMWLIVGYGGYRLRPTVASLSQRSERG
jgi:predicted MFS family arabinose efflux permease